MTSLPDGTRVTVVRCVPAKQLRLRLEREEWSRARTVQLRLIPSVHGITVALHAEGLPDAGVREEMLDRWTHAMETWGAFSGRKVGVSRSGPLSRDPAGDKDAQEAPDLEEGLAAKGAADLKKAGPARGTRGARKVVAKEPRGRAKKGAAPGVKKPVSAKPRGRVEKSVAAKSRVGVKGAAPAKRAPASRKASGRKTVAARKPSTAKKTRSRR
ncbi:MAG: hypothetical protein EOO71_38020 [Myxococcaceae bacterium]|nr:MAG: hypothetical protein EOO71_38020 [Myxococcaceae bacterium]